MLSFQPHSSSRRLRSSDTGTPASRASRMACRAASRDGESRMIMPDVCSHAAPAIASRLT